jgi:hypothetical protein
VAAGTGKLALDAGAAVGDLSPHVGLGQLAEGKVRLGMGAAIVTRESCASSRSSSQDMKSSAWLARVSTPYDSASSATTVRARSSGIARSHQ